MNQREDFNEFCRPMCTKWDFRNKLTLALSETAASSPKSTLEPAKGHHEVFLGESEKAIFKIPAEHCRYNNTSTEEWEAIRYLADEVNIAIKKAAKMSFVIIWGRTDYLFEAEERSLVI